jgi:phosphoribosylformimino-5-aminoimidazole carboxamide ribotide isomerase
MRVIPVIDLMGGQVVRGVAGKRSEYRPVQSLIAVDAKPATVARAFVEQFGFEDVYVADLDAIMGSQPNVAAWNDIAAQGLRLWLDAGVGDATAARGVLSTLRSAGTGFQLVVGLESLKSLDDLVAIIKAWDFPIVSLDLKARVPQTRIDELRDADPIAIAQALDDCGIRELIVLDLADVGLGQGTRTLDLCRQLSALRRFRLICGGGVRGLDDLKAMADVGCDSVLVASALHDGRLTREDIRQVENLPH